ncbi:clathrin coat assembly protein AP180 isoform X2 [Corylus avellana]|uniref:clathrin coat assembly protein AP180 isoform X2 n=1 Tax=Corylus avellana TaxID=13451 RepID=UPI00286B9150|nr:clathrin coat assembly protein AP180 isoform X2 [Corylus avellana]
MLPTMPSKLRKAFGAVKDQTSISLAKVSSTSAANLEVLILRATTHDEIPINERYVNEILLLVSSDKTYAAACAQAISKRVGRTRNWVVAVKSLMLVLRTFQDGDPYFPKEVLHAMKRGAKILNLSSFRDDSNSSPWDYTAFVRTFALYLDERLDCFLTGKLQRRVSYRQRESIHQRIGRAVASPVRDMKPAMLLDRITYWQRLIDRAIATRPTGEARTNRLILITLHAIVQESFDLYRDISEGLARLLDSFFHLQYQSCVSAFQACVKATKQFQQLSSFYDFCKSIGVGRTSEYPSVQKISEELIETLQDFLRDQASFPSHHGRISPLLLPAPPRKATGGKDRGSSSERFPYNDQSDAPERLSQDRGLGSGRSRCTSLEDLMSITGSVHEEKQSTLEDFISIANDSVVDAELEKQKQEHEQEQENNKTSENQKDCWESVLFESTNGANGFEPSVDSLPQHHQYNPFLQDTSTENDRGFSATPTFHAAAALPTFLANNPQETMISGIQNENDPFAAHPGGAMADEQVSNGSPMNEKSLLDEQQLWLENQSKIIAKHMA